MVARGALVVAAATLLAGCAAGYSASPAAYTRGHDYSAPSAHPTASEQAATFHAALAYRRLLVGSFDALGASLSRLAVDAAAGDRAAAQTDELAAQAAYDGFRVTMTPGSDSANQLDGEAWNTRSGAPEGLHAIEKILWSGSPMGSVATLARRVSNDSLFSGFALSRLVLTPQQQLAQIQTALTWAVEVPLVNREEIYSHRDLIDVAAVAAFARRALSSLTPLGLLVDPSTTRVAATRLAALDRLVAAGSGATALRDSTVASARWRSLAQAIDAADAPLGTLQGRLAGFGTGRLYP